MNLHLTSMKIVNFINRKDSKTFGSIKYSNFRRMFSYILDSNNNYELRKIFLYLLDQNYIIKLKTNNKINSYLYKFNFINERPQGALCAQSATMPIVIDFN